LATTAFSPFVPFFANAAEVHPVWASTADRPDPESAYWLLRTLATLGENRYDIVESTINDYLKSCRQKAHAFVDATDRDTASLSGDELTAALTKANCAFMDTVLAETRKVLQDVIMAAAEDSRLSFEMDANL
ncbi:MAG: C69 family dipeptidase, partial [Clostridia bacterium]